MPEYPTRKSARIRAHSRRRRHISIAAVLSLIAGLVLAVVPPAPPEVADAAIPAPTATTAVISVKVGGDRAANGTVGGLAGVKLSLYDAGLLGTTVLLGQGIPGARYNPSWSWTTCTSDVNGDCNFVIPIRAGLLPSATGVAQDTRFWVAQAPSDAPPAGYYSNPNMRLGGFAATPEYDWEYRFRTDIELRAGTLYTSTAPMPLALASDPDRGFMRNREASNAEGSYVVNIGRTTGIWSQSRVNPPLPTICGLRVAVVADTSGSLGATGMASVKSAIGAFVDAFKGTPTTMSLFSFSNVSPGSSASNNPTPLPVTTTAQAAAFKAQYTAWVEGGGTNWDRGLAAAANSGFKYDLVVMLTDGNPTLSGATPGSTASSYNAMQDVDAGIFSANQLKAGGTRVVAIGAGPGLTPASEYNLRAVSGTTEDSDYYRLSDFGAAATVLGQLAAANCQGSIQVQKMIVPPGGTTATAVPAPAGWQFSAATTEPTKVNINAPASVATTATSNGIVNFGLTYTSPATSGIVRVQETQQPGYAIFPVGTSNAVCINSLTGLDVPVTNVNSATTPGFTVNTMSLAQIQCKVYNTTVGNLVVEKTSNPATGAVVNPGSTVSYTLSFKNTGGTAVPVDYTDYLNNVLDDATWQGSPTIVPAAGLTVVRATTPVNKLTITGSVPAASTVTVTYTVVVKTGTTGDGILKNVLAPTTVTPPTDCVPNDPTILCTTHPITGSYTLSKASLPATGALVSPGDVITYTVTAVGSNGPVTGVVITDNLTDVLDDATFVAGSAKLTVGTAAPVNVADPTGTNPIVLQTAGFTLAPGVTATLTYKVTVKADAWSRTIKNVVTATSTGNVPPTSCITCTTTHPTPGRLLIQKIGESSSATWVGMPGSQWEIHTDASGVMGPVLASPVVVPDGSAVGLFRLTGIPAGTYWLVETVAPTGFSLLAEPVKFTLSATGVVTIGQGAGAGVVTSTDADGDGVFQITVRDVPAMKLPEAGGTGTLPYLVGGSLLVVMAGVFWFAGRRRKRGAHVGSA